MAPIERNKSEPPDPYRDIMGIDQDSARLAENLAAYADILAELQKLRRLDLTDIHPAVVFDPSWDNGAADDER
jgi:hypothetical protein